MKLKALPRSLAQQTQIKHDDAKEVFLDLFRDGQWGYDMLLGRPEFQMKIVYVKHTLLGF